MGFFDKLFRKEDPSDALVRHTGAVFSSCVEISQNFFKKESNSILEYISKNDIPASDFNKFVKHGVFEILLLNTVFVQRSGALYVGIRTALFKNTLTVHLHAYCKANGITDDLPCTYSDFVLNRYDFYGDIVEALLLAKDDYRYDDVVHSDLASVFFESPLSLDKKRSKNTALSQRVTRAARIMIDNIQVQLELNFMGEP